MADVFHQHSTARKSFITPNLDKDIKSTLEATVFDEWLYGQKLTDQVKDAKNIKKASTSLKAPENSTAKKTTSQLIGVLVAASPAVEYSKIYIVRLERAKWLALTINDNNFEAYIKITNSIMEDLIWWKINLLTGSNLIRTQNYKITISSDASRSGWGAESNLKVTHGFWSQKDKKFYINYLELLAAFFALKCFASNLSNCEVLMRIDNITAISYINKAGGIKFPHLSALAREIWQWCEGKNIWIKASYIASKENIDADAASRVTNLDTEWELRAKYFKQIVEKFGPCTIDLFASKINTKCKKFCSRYPDPEALVVESFTILWEKKQFYAFPPFAIVLPVLRKIINDRATGEEDPSSITQAFSSGRETIREAITEFLIKGVPEDSVDFMVNSITPSTLKQYEGCLKKWTQFATDKKFNVFDPNTANIIEFLTKRFNENVGYGTLNSTRSAISLIVKRDLSKDDLISRFFKGVFKKRPATPKYSTTWNTEQVLEYIENQNTIENQTLKQVSEIATTLLVLITAHRLQTIFLIDIDNISQGSSGLQIKIPELIKTSKLGKNQPILIVPFFKQRQKVCVASIILYYLKITRSIRAENKKLFLSTVKPHNLVTAQTIGHWIKSLLNKAGIDTEKFSAYSAKHASVSAAYRKGVDIDTIRKTAGWTDGSATFARFYNRPLTESSNKFASAVITKINSKGKNNKR
ncbi:uncharacterized protein LOC123263077 [Cotesia glomerata]|uniref:uncharacterized protein LOC123263077 n=1 Tax=Cotesia glomerata TaxID=32391 RepID=UPI001D023E3B|nr:uncharacterized protein LOC123263077 [Cotesia glomerata]